MQPIFAEAHRLLAKGEPFVLTTVVRTKGSTPQKPGAKLLVRKDGTAVGTLGGGCIEADVWAEAKTVLEEGTGAQMRRFLLNEDIASRDGLVCGGNMDIMIDPVLDQKALKPILHEILNAYEGKGDCALATLAEPSKSTGPMGAKLFVRVDGSTIGTLGSKALDAEAVKTAIALMPKGREQWVETSDGARAYVEAFTTPPTVVIAGGGHVGKAIYNVARPLGFRVVIVDDRPQFANKERFPEADKVVVDDFDKGLRELNMTPNCYVVVATRGHKLDDLALIEAARSRAGYVGLLGSKRKAILIFRDLLKVGIPETRIREIRAPVGLDLGGRSPEEIAVSIMAEILSIKNQKDAKALTMDTKLVDQAKTLTIRTPKAKTAAR